MNRHRDDQKTAGTERSILREVHLLHIVELDGEKRLDDQDLVEVPRKLEGMELEPGLGPGATLVPCTEDLVVEQDYQIDHKKLRERRELDKSLDEGLLGVDLSLGADSSKDRAVAIATDPGLERPLGKLERLGCLDP